jgi:3-methyladenine DNA glycosylase AlkC
MKEKFSLKDHLFNAVKVALLADALKNVYPTFEKENFEQAVLVAFPRLELKERIVHIRACLKKYLPADYQAAVGVLLSALPPPLDKNLTDDDFGDFIYAPYSDFVAHYGCTQEHLAFSLAALKEMTQRFSAEDAIRYFINAFPKETLKTLYEWTYDDNYHVRRLCSEGTRPKLPWSQKINIQPAEALPILHQLFADKTRYVTRSVANHLNDIAKIQPDTVVETLKIWKNSGKQQETEMSFILKHSTRTLVKNGHEEALTLLGFGNSDGLTVSDLTHDEAVKIGESLAFSFNISATEAKQIVIDYLVYFQSKQGTLTNKKVFKLQTIDIASNKPVTLQKRHVFRADMTTRTLYTGVHKIEIQINGTIMAAFEFDLLAS